MRLCVSRGAFYACEMSLLKYGPFDAFFCETETAAAKPKVIVTPKHSAAKKRFRYVRVR